MKKKYLLFLLTIPAVSGGWYAVTDSHALAESSSRKASIPAARTPRASGEPGGKSFAVPGDVPSRRLKAIEPVATGFPRVNEGLAAEPTGPRRKEAGTPRQVILDPAQPGHSLTTGNSRVEVEGLTVSPGETKLDAAITELRPRGAAEPATRSAGLTYGEELFRTKWGWAAFNHARRAAAGATPTPAAP